MKTCTTNLIISHLDERGTNDGGGGDCCPVCGKLTERNNKVLK